MIRYSSDCAAIVQAISLEVCVYLLEVCVPPWCLAGLASVSPWNLIVTPTCSSHLLLSELKNGNNNVTYAHQALRKCMQLRTVHSATQTTYIMGCQGSMAPRTNSRADMQ
jgi:hypothetical protein